MNEASDQSVQFTAEELTRFYLYQESLKSPSTSITVIEEFSMQKSKSDHSVFCRNSSSGIILLVVYVDDIVISGSDSKGISSLKSFLQSQFHTKNLGMLRYFLALKLYEANMKSSYLKGNMCLIYYLRLES